MSENTKIAWTDSTISFWWGCHKIAPGCKECYAKSITERFAGDFWGPTKPRLWIKSACASLLKLNAKAEREGRERLVFINSMSDFFEDFDGPIVDRKGESLLVCDTCGKFWPDDEAALSESCDCGRFKQRMEWARLADLRREAFETIDKCPWLRCLLLTKRPENIKSMWPTEDDGDGGRLAAMIFGEVTDDGVIPAKGKLIRRRDNVWLGTSISDQATADKYIPALLNCRDLCPVLFVSAEPLLGPVDFGPPHHWAACDVRGGIGWVIIGCESDGPRVGRLGTFTHGATWRDGAADIVRQCRDAGVSAFMKQVPINGRVSHDPAEWPEQLRVRQFPQPERAT